MIPKTGAYHRKTKKGDQFWFLNGKLHRTDGSAVIYALGEQRWHFAGSLYATWEK
jgi:hypothetical protein